MGSLTAGQQSLLTAIHRRLVADPAIEAAWLAGSLGRGEGDAFSDVDVLALVGQGPAGETGLRYAREGVREIAEPVLVMPLFGGRVVSVVTADWERFDISFIEAADLGRYDAARLTPIFNRGSREPPRPAPTAYEVAPEALLALINEFLRVLGLLGVAEGRREWLLALQGFGILRGLSIDLMLEENRVSPADRGGALRRNPLLTAEQRAALEGLPPLAANRASVLEANAALSAIFLPRARRLAARVGLPWPSAFESATKRHLRERLGLVIEDEGAA